MTIKLKGSTDGSVSFTAPADTSPSGSDITLTLPTTAGSANQFVKNSGTAGTLEYSSMVETSTGVGVGTTAPDYKLHVNVPISSGNERTAELAHGADVNFRLMAANGVANNSSGNEVSRFGTYYEGTGWDSYVSFIRGSSSQNGSVKFFTSGGTASPLTLNANGSIGSNITQEGTSPQHFFRETGTTYGSTLWSITRDSDAFSIRWNNAGPYALVSATSGGSVTNVQLKGGQLIIDGNNALDAICVYNTTTSSGANVNVHSSGLVRRSTSSAKYKTNVETIEDNYSDAILNCRPVYYRSTCEGDNPDYGWWGFIAEEVAEIDPRLVYYKEVDVALDGKGGKTETPCELEPEGVAYDRFVPHLLNLIKRQKQAIETLETRVAALEAGS